MAIRSVLFMGHCDIVDLDLISRKIMWGAYLLYYLRQKSKIWCVEGSLDGDGPRTILGLL